MKVIEIKSPKDLLDIHNFTPEQGIADFNEEQVSPLDYRFTSEDLQYLHPRHNFWESEYTYNQDDIRPSICVITGTMGAFGDLINQKWTNEQLYSMSQFAEKYGFQEGRGMRIDKGVDMVRHWFTEHGIPKPVYDNYLIRSDTIDVREPVFQGVLNLGYTIVGGYRGNKYFRRDREDDGIINNWDIGTPTYGHCINFIPKPKSEKEDYVYIKDSYKGRDTNIYKIHNDILVKAANAGVFYSNVRFFEIKEKKHPNSKYADIFEAEVKDPIFSRHDGDEPLSEADTKYLIDISLNRFRKKYLN